MHGIPVGDEPPETGMVKQAVHVLNTVPDALAAARTEELTLYLDRARRKAEMMTRDNLDPERGRTALHLSTVQACPDLATALYKSGLGLVEQVTAVKSYLEVVRAL